MMIPAHGYDERTVYLCFLPASAACFVCMKWMTLEGTKAAAVHKL